MRQRRDGGTGIRQIPPKRTSAVRVGPTDRLERESVQAAQLCHGDGMSALYIYMTILIPLITTIANTRTHFHRKGKGVIFLTGNEIPQVSFPKK